ncbi:hypothetical protein [Campylobacter concisus]|jgi:hypothetical protein|uniref:hypothetical protein n=1 Tax=Campylobacter concisus TaxID=199 RepID=UPI00122C3249|nr:hypothetical protein [Campylobacter concisus]VTX99879.1 Uncharacterised protein [Campylobacter concisus]
MDEDYLFVGYEAILVEDELIKDLFINFERYKKQPKLPKGIYGEYFDLVLKNFEINSNHQNIFCDQENNVKIFSIKYSDDNYYSMDSIDKGKNYQKLTRLDIEMATDNIQSSCEIIKNFKKMQVDINFLKNIEGKTARYLFPYFIDYKDNKYVVYDNKISKVKNCILLNFKKTDDKPFITKRKVTEKTNNDLFKSLNKIGFSGKTLTCDKNFGPKKFIIDELKKCCDQYPQAQEIEELTSINFDDSKLYILTNDIKKKHYFRCDKKLFEIKNIELFDLCIKNDYKVDNIISSEHKDVTITSIDISDKYIRDDKFIIYKKLTEILEVDDKIDTDTKKELQNFVDSINNQSKKVSQCLGILPDIACSIHFIMFNIEKENVLYAIKPVDKIYNQKNIHFGFYKNLISGYKPSDTKMMKIFADFEGINTFNNYDAIKELSYFKQNETKYTKTFVQKDNIYINEEFYWNLFVFTKSGYENGIQKVLIKLFYNAKVYIYQKNISSILKSITNKNTYSIFGLNPCKIAKISALSIVSLLMILFNMLSNMAFLDKLGISLIILTAIYAFLLLRKTQEQHIFETKENFFKFKNFIYMSLHEDLKDTTKIIQENSEKNKELENTNQSINEFFDLKEKVYQYNANRRSIIFASLAIIISVLALTGYIEHEMKQFFTDTQTTDGYIMSVIQKIKSFVGN